MYSAVNASTQEPRDFMSSEKRFEISPRIKNLQESISKDYKFIFSGYNRIMTLNMLESDSCKLIAPILRYINEHPEIGTKSCVGPDILSKCRAFDVRMYIYDIIEYSETVNNIKNEIERVQGIIEFLKKPSNAKSKKKIDSVWEAELSLKTLKWLNEPHLFLSDSIIKLYRNIGYYESTINSHTARLNAADKTQQPTYPRQIHTTTDRKKPTYLKPVYRNKRSHQIF